MKNSEKLLKFWETEKDVFYTTFRYGESLISRDVYEQIQQHIATEAAAQMAYRRISPIGSTRTKVLW
jgi:hypothetical protein